MEIVGKESDIDLVALNLEDVKSVEKLFGAFVTPDDYYGICYKDNFDDDDYVNNVSDTGLDIMFLVVDTYDASEIFNKVKNEIKSNILNDGIDYDCGAHVALYNLNNGKSILVQVDGGTSELQDYKDKGHFEIVIHFYELDEIESLIIKNEVKKILK